MMNDQDVKREIKAVLFCIAGLMVFLPLSDECEAERRIMSRAEAFRTFALLLKIPPAPPEVTVTVRNRLEEEGVVIEDISWESLDGEKPEAYVIRPKEAEGPLPAIVCLHGTGGDRASMCTKEFGQGEWTQYGSSKPHTRLLGWARELTRRGYLTLALTQRGLGPRTPDTNDQAKNLLVRGRTLMGALVYEIRQAITYLENRDDVNHSRIGITGLSFGGITTFYTWLVDDRPAAAASICGGVGSVDELLKRGSPSYHGLYWWIPDMLTRGDQGDFAAAMAPRPLMLWAPLEDIGMPKEGVDRFLTVARPAYEAAGAPQTLVVHQLPGEHSFTTEAFHAMAAFFDQWLR
jgi:dienelactone hydrolase